MAEGSAPAPAPAGGSQHSSTVHMPAAAAAPSAAPASMSAGQMAVWIVVAIVALFILAGFFMTHNRAGDAYYASVRAHDAIGYQTGYMQKQLNDMQFDGRQNFNKQYDWRLDELRFGQPYGNHTQRPRFFGHGGQIVGSNLSTSTAVDGSVGNLGIAEGF